MAIWLRNKSLKSKFVQKKMLYFLGNLKDFHSAKNEKILLRINKAAAADAVVCFHMNRVSERVS